MLCILLLSCLAVPVFGATGAVSGIVVDARNGAPVRGAEVAVVGTDLNTRTDLNGLFTIANVETGTWNVRVTHETYSTELVGGVEVSGGGDQSLGIVLSPSETPLAADPSSGTDEGPATYTEVVTVTAEATAASEEALLVERRTADRIEDSISRQEISKTSDSTSASVMQRVTGISVVDGKYVYVRGLGERYSQTTMNGSVIPTTEPEKRVVPLDLFPSNLLDRITVAKSYTPDKPGDFAGGMVEMESLDYPSSTSVSLSFGTGYNANVTGKEVGTYAGGLGFSGRGGEAMPQGLPAERVAKGGLLGTGFSTDQLVAIGQQFLGTWERQPEAVPYDQSYSLTMGTTLGRLGIVLSGSYGNAWDQVSEIQNFYSLGLDELELGTNYEFDTAEQTVRQGVVANLAYRLTDNHHVRMRSFLTEVATSEARDYEGFNKDAFNNVRDSRLRYENENITTAQISGEHYFGRLGSAGSLFDWNASQSEGRRDSNLREVLYEERSPGVFQLADESQSGFMLYNDLDDQIDEARANWSTMFSFDRVSGSVKAGGAYLSRHRDFVSRRFRFVPQSRTSLDLTLPPSELFVSENLGPRGFLINEETRPTDTYEGNHEITAAYLMGDVLMGRFRVVAGARFEESQQDVVTRDLFNLNAVPITTENHDADVLPALNVAYQLDAATNLRFGYSRTVNRPEFRELAPFEFTDVVGGRAVVGNPDLKRALIDSADVRWEWFPRGGEVVAASVFYKFIDSPIEQIVQPTAQLRTSYANAREAENWGIELELRRSLAFLHENLLPWAVNTNYTFVESEVVIGELEQNLVTTLQRPLAGQPQHTFNTALDYELFTTGTVFRTLYNYTSEKISDVGALGIPDIYESPRKTLDFILLQDLDRWSNGLRLKLSAENILDDDREFTQGGLTQRLYSSGREYSLSFSYKPF